MKKTGFLSHSFLLKVLYKLRGGVITKWPKGATKGRVLFSHDITPFLNPNHPLGAHANYWTATVMVQAFLDRGYIVDIIDCKNPTFIPKHSYTYFVDLELNLDKRVPHLNSDCIKILHIVSAHWLFQNTAEYERCLAVQNRRGVTVFPQRLMNQVLSIESADCATMIGNKFTSDTYAFAGKKIYSTPLPAGYEYPFPEEKDINAARKNFVWFGGAGAIHKGLDLVLEAFAEMPEYHLTVFGKSTQDPDVLKAYGRELKEMKNLTVLTYIDFEGPGFEKILQETIAIVYPSCSEGTSGSVVHSMHAGIIPIVNYESGVNVEDFGILLPSTTIENIMTAVRTVATLPETELKRRAKAAWEYARQNYSRENFTKKYGIFVDELERGAHRK